MEPSKSGMQTEAMHKLEFYPSKRNLFGVLAGGLVFLAGGIWMLSQAELTLKATIAGWLGVVFGGGAAVAICILLIRGFTHPQPLLQLDDRGITFFDIRAGQDQVAWSLIKGFGEYRVYSQRFITIFVSDPEQLLDAKAGAVRRKMVEMNLRLTGAPYSIAPATLDYPRKKLLPTLKEYHHKYR